MSTYYSHKTILTPIYTKAVVLDDGIHIRSFTPDEVYMEDVLYTDNQYSLGTCSDVDE
jgi:hypothetical protein